MSSREIAPLYSVDFLPVLTLVDRPKVRLIAQTEVDPQSTSGWLEDTGLDQWSPDPNASDPESIAEFAGRACYLSYANPASRSNRQYLGNIMKQGHGSVLEHATFTFAIGDVSRRLTEQLNRHRVGYSPSQTSQRYVDYRRLKRVIVPPAYLKHGKIDYDNEAFRHWLHGCRLAFRSYELQCEAIEAEHPDNTTTHPAERSLSRTAERPLPRKEKFEAARGVLPNDASTYIVITVNGRSLRHLLRIRGSRHAGWEIRRMSNQLFGSISKFTPAILQDITRHAVHRDDEDDFEIRFEWDC